MTARHFYRDDTGVHELVGQVQLGKWSVQHCAEEGRVGNGSITVDDPDATFDIRGHRIWYITESDIVDPDDQIIWHGYTADRSWTRGAGERVTDMRVITVNVVDDNSLLSRRVQVGNDAKRPAEKDVHRVQWLINTSEAGTFDDTTTYIHTDRTTSMDAVDYRGQPNLNVIDDCAQATGKNYWVDYFPVTRAGVWYGHPGEPDYVAAIAISNDLADVDSDSIFPPSEDAKLVRDPSRVFSGVYLPYDGGYVYKSDVAGTGTTFAIRDTTMPSINVKTAAKAAKRATRYLADLDTEDDRITCTLYLPSTHVNKAKAGMWINCKFSHFPGYETFTPMRILSRTISEAAPQVYKMDLELSGGDILPPAGNGAARLYFPMNRDSGIDINPDIAFDNTGDDPGLGRAYYPLLGDQLSYHDYSGHEGEIWDGIQVETDGTVDITFTASFAAVVSTEVEAVFTVWVDGDVVGTTSFAEFHAGPGFFSRSGTVVVTDLAVTAGQLIHASIETTGTFLGGYKAPAGVGGPDESLTVVGTFE